MLLPPLSFKLKEKLAITNSFGIFRHFVREKNQTIHPIRGEIAPSLSPHTSISHLYPDLRQTENCGQDVYSCFAAAAVHVVHLMWLLNEDRKLFQLLPSARFPNGIDLGNWFKSFSQSHATIHVRSERQFLFVERKTHYANPFTKPPPQGIFGRANAFLFSPLPSNCHQSLFFFCSNKRLPENESTCASQEEQPFSKVSDFPYICQLISFLFQTFFVFVFYDSPPRKSIFDRDEIQSPKIKSPTLD